MMKANNILYQSYYDDIYKKGLMPLVEMTIDKFDFEGYYNFRDSIGYSALSDREFVQDFIFELLSDGNAEYTYSGHLCCKLTKTICEISYGISENYRGPLENIVSTSVSELRMDKFKRLLNEI